MRPQGNTKMKIKISDSTSTKIMMTLLIGYGLMTLFFHCISKQGNVPSSTNFI
jgi:hypothetical protein